MDIVVCESCGDQIHDPVDIYGEEDWVLCRHCDWELQCDQKFISTQNIIDAGKQIPLFEEYISWRIDE